MNTYINQIVYIEGKLYKVVNIYEGNRDLSHHGSPYYETFIEAQDVETGEVHTFGDQEYSWRDARMYLNSLEDTLKEIAKLVPYTSRPF